MPQYETLKSEEFRYGNNFIEVARKKVEEKEFLSISKGFYNQAGEKRYKASIGFPDTQEAKDFIIKSFQEL